MFVIGCLWKQIGVKVYVDVEDSVFVGIQKFEVVLRFLVFGLEYGECVFLGYYFVYLYFGE